jgi:outer membrane assembly lipoprotein YfiO
MLAFSRVHVLHHNLTRRHRATAQRALRRFARRVLLVATVAVAACRPAFRLERFGSDLDAMYTAGVSELKLKHWDNAILVFDKLTSDLQPRDTLLPRAQFYLGHARRGKADHLAAAMAYNKVAETYPEDSLADDAMSLGAHEYQALWRSPELDSQYGVTAQAAYRTLIAVYPDSPHRKDAETQLARLEEMFATKEYLSGYYYFRRKAYDPALVYFKTVVSRHGESARARDAYLRMIESYRIIRYKEEAAEACTAVRQRFASDPEVAKLCPPEAAARDSTRPAVPPTDAPRKP